MFEILLKHFKTLENYNEEIEKNCINLTNHFQEITPKILNILSKIKEKYNYKNFKNLVFEKDLDNHLEFWRGSGEYSLSVHLASLNGVHDPDEQFGIFYKEYDFNNGEDYIEITKEIDNFYFFEIKNELFYTWISYLWQEINGNDNGFAIKIIENNASSIFCINDFAWYENSKFCEFQNQPTEKLKLLNRKLSIDEIYSRVKLKYKQDLNEKRILKKENEKIYLELKNGQLKIEDIFNNIKFNEELLPKIGFYNSTKFIEKHNELINMNWKDITFKKTTPNSGLQKLGFWS